MPKHLEKARGYITLMLDHLPKDGAWVNLSDLASSMEIDQRLAGRVTNLAKRSVMKQHDISTRVVMVRLHPDLCRTAAK